MLFLTIDRIKGDYILLMVLSRRKKTNESFGFLLIILTQPPEDVPSLVPRDVVEPQSISGCRGRSKAGATIGLEVPSMRSPTPAS